MEGELLTFRNLGNTCYANSVLQLLKNSSYISSLISQRSSPICRLLSSYSRPDSNPAELLRIVQQKYPYFQGYLQYDAHEFLLCLVQQLEDELYRDASSKPPEDSETHSSDDKTQQTDELARVLQTCYQIVEFCPQCSQQRLRHVKDENLVLQFDRKNPRIDQMIKSYFSDNAATVCENCGVEMQVSCQVQRFAEQLILVFNRFTNSYKKLDYAVRVPETLTLQDFNNFEYNYRLNVVINHQGSMSGGHYTASILRDGMCYEVSDARSYRQIYQMYDSRAYIVSYSLVTEAEPCKTDIIDQTYMIADEAAAAYQRAQQNDFHFGDDPTPPEPYYPSKDNILLPLSLQREVIYQAVSRNQVQLVIAEKLVAFPELAFLANLRRLFLKYLRISSFEPKFLPPNISFLSIQHCRLSSFPNLAHLLSLEIIDFSHNRLSEVLGSCIPKQIISLNLSYNRIKCIPDLSNCLSLRTADLSNNTRLVPNFYCLLPPTLENLYLRGCRLRYFGQIGGLMSLRCIDLSGNSLSDEEYSQMQGLVIIK